MGQGQSLAFWRPTLRTSFLTISLAARLLRWSALWKPPAQKPKPAGSRSWGYLAHGLPCTGVFILTYLPAKALLAVPAADEQDYIHDKYLNELIPGKFLPQTREGLLAIARRMRDQDGIEALILGGTELPLILTDESALEIPFLDTTQIHVNAIVEAAMV